MKPDLKNLRGIRSFATDLSLEWNTSFDDVKKILQDREARCLQEQGFRLLRFEETMFAEMKIDLQYQLHFSPDYDYGLRDADAAIEVVGLKIDEKGGHKRIVDAYGEILKSLRATYGEPDVNRGASEEDLEKLIHQLDHSRAPSTAMANWHGPDTVILHELVVTHMLKQRVRFTPVVEDVVVVNRTGKPGLDLRVGFDGGRATAQLKKDEERIVEIPPASGAEITVKMGDREASLSLPPKRETRTVHAHRSWLTGKLSLRLQ